jgi:hypothetical protein
MPPPARAAAPIEVVVVDDDDDERSDEEENAAVEEEDDDVVDEEARDDDVLGESPAPRLSDRSDVSSTPSESVASDRPRSKGICLNSTAWPVWVA